MQWMHVARHSMSFTEMLIVSTTIERYVFEKKTKQNKKINHNCIAVHAWRDHRKTWVCKWLAVELLHKLREYEYESNAPNAPIAHVWHGSNMPQFFVDAKKLIWKIRRRHRRIELKTCYPSLTAVFSFLFFRFRFVNFHFVNEKWQTPTNFQRNSFQLCA